MPEAVEVYSLQLGDTLVCHVNVEAYPPIRPQVNIDWLRGFLRRVLGR